MDKNKFLKFNLNFYIWVRLTGKGISILQRYSDRYKKPDAEPTTVARLEETHDVTKDGYYRFQMHEFMNVYGNDVSDACFETIVYFDPKDMKIQDTSVASLINNHGNNKKYHILSQW